MTQTAEGCGWLAMYVARTGTGYTIEFLNIDHGFGALTAATTFDSDDAPLLMGQSWVQPPNLEGKLLRFLRTTADLSWLPDFEDVPNDEHGAPIVWCHAKLCSGCGARSKVEASKILTRTTCAKCKSVIEIFQKASAG